jgi:hypothetical protein
MPTFMAGKGRRISSTKECRMIPAMRRRTTFEWQSPMYRTTRSAPFCRCSCKVALTRRPHYPRWPVSTSTSLVYPGSRAGEWFVFFLPRLQRLRMTGRPDCGRSTYRQRIAAPPLVPWVRVTKLSTSALKFLPAQDRSFGRPGLSRSYVETARILGSGFKVSF